MTDLASGNAETAQAGGATDSVVLTVGVFEALVLASHHPTCLIDVVGSRLILGNEAWGLMCGVGAGVKRDLGLAAFGRSFSDAIASLPRHWESDAPKSIHCSLTSSEGHGRDVTLEVTSISGGKDSLLLLRVAAELEPHVLGAALAEALANEASVLQQQVQLHPAIERLARVGHWTSVEGFKELTWSPGLFEIAGIPMKGSIERTEGRSGIHPDDREAWLSAREALDGRDLVYRWTRPNGEVRWLRTRMGRAEIAGEAPVAFGVVQDVTEELEAKMALATELAFVHNIAAHVPGAIYKARRSPEGVASVPYVSASAMDVMGVSANDVMRDQRVFFSTILPEDLPKLLSEIGRTCEDLSTLRTSFRAEVPGRGRRWIQAEATTQREADGAIVWHGFITDVTDSLLAAEALERQHHMLQAVQKSQATFIELDDKRKAFESLLSSFLKVTGCAFGFIGEVLSDGKQQPYLRMQAATDIAWDEKSRAMVKAAQSGGLEFHNLKTLFGHGLTSGETVISNQPALDSRSGGLPAGHPPLTSFLAVPISLAGKQVAMVGLANKPDGFSQDDVEFLQPLLGTVRELVMAARAHEEKRRARLQFQTTSAMLAEKTLVLQGTFDSMNQGLVMVDAQGRIRFFNQRLLELLNLSEAQMGGQALFSDVVMFQRERGDFGFGDQPLPLPLQTAIEDPMSEEARQYVRRTSSGKVMEVTTRPLQGGGFVRVFTDVTTYVDAQEALKEERQRLQWVLEATRPGIWEVNLETGETLCSDRWWEMLGYARDELALNGIETWNSLLHPDDLPRAARMRTLHLKGDMPYYEADVRMRHKQGHWLWVNTRGRVHRRDDQGRALYMSGTLLDIHERVAAQEEVRLLNTSLERRVAERTAELERSMKDMEAISYSIAHDLRAPLRSVNGFASVIADEANENLSPEARRMFDRIARSSRNMGQMITDMLELLRVVRVDLEAVPVNMNQLAHSVSESLAPGTPNALIGIKPLPPVMGDATLLRQVLVNLMDNALKYARHRPQPELVLGFDERRRAFYLSDNGMGFDMARAGKLFGLFQRMHSDSEVPGTGVGLAIVARIVERHGGRIWADATPGKGATFWWTLPRGTDLGAKER